VAFFAVVNNEAGETMALNGKWVVYFFWRYADRPLRGTVDFASTVPTDEQPGLQISVSPRPRRWGSYELHPNERSPNGISVEFVDYQDKAPFGSFMDPTKGCEAEDNFVLTTVDGSPW